MPEPLPKKPMFEGGPDWFSFALFDAVAEILAERHPDQWPEDYEAGALIRCNDTRTGFDILSVFGDKYEPVTLGDALRYLMRQPAPPLSVCSDCGCPMPNDIGGLQDHKPGCSNIPF